MKKTFLLITSLLIITSTVFAQSTVNINSLQEYGEKAFKVDDEKPYTGRVFDLYKSTGEKKLEGYYRNGIKNGKWKWWNEDGKMDSSGTYKIGIKDGKWIHSTDIGNGKYEVKYTKGNIDLVTFTDNLGQTYSGIPVNEESKADGQYLGQEHEYNFSKYPEIFLTIKNGKEDGLATRWYKDGQIKQQGSHIDGKRHGKWTVWDTKGDGLGEFEYDHGQINGFYENDSLRFVSTYEIPTSSMENTFLVGEKIFVEKIKNNSNMLNEVILFKHPRDSSSLFLKRVIARPGDTLEIINKTVYINNVPSPLPENGKFLMPSTFSETFTQSNIFLGNQGNKDQFKKLTIPRKGDQIKLSPENAKLLLHLMLLDGHELKLVNNGIEFPFTMVSPDELYRRKGKEEVYKPYYNWGGSLLVPWLDNIPKGSLLIDGQPIINLDYYAVEQDYYWVMGDNRDDSLDSRYWGFVPFSYITHRVLKSYNRWLWPESK